MSDLDLQIAALPPELMEHPDFEKALRLALAMLDDQEAVMPLVVKTWAEAEVVRG